MGCSTKQKGDVSEAVILAELVKLGFTVLQPFGDNQSYDLVVEKDGQFFRIQCKTGILKNGVVNFRTVSTLPRFKGGYDQRSYKGLVEFFVVYCPQNGGIYVLPPNEMPEGTAYLRVKPTKNSQSKGVRMAEDYILNEDSFET